MIVVAFRQVDLASRQLEPVIMDILEPQFKLINNNYIVLLIDSRSTKSIGALTTFEIIAPHIVCLFVDKCAILYDILMHKMRTNGMLFVIEVIWIAVPL